MPLRRAYVDAKKVGLDLADAIGASENNTIKICDVPNTGVTVQRGHTLDGLGKYYQQTIEESAEEPVNVVQVLKDKQVDVLVCYLPWVPRTRRSSTPRPPSTPRSPSSTPSRSSSPAPRSGRTSSPSRCPDRR